MILLWRATAAGVAVPLVVTALVVAGALVDEVPAVSAAALAGAAAVGAAWWLVPRAAYRRWRYAVHDDVVELRHGIVWRTHSLVPHYRVQHIDVEQGPIERRLGLAKLELHTASAATDASLPGIELERAEEIRAHILAAAAVDDGV